jgi:hypothetical protein
VLTAQQAALACAEAPAPSAVAAPAAPQEVSTGLAAPAEEAEAVVAPVVEAVAASPVAPGGEPPMSTGAADPPLPAITVNPLCGLASPSPGLPLSPAAPSLERAAEIAGQSGQALESTLAAVATLPPSRLRLEEGALRRVAACQREQTKCLANLEDSPSPRLRFP